MKTGLTFLRDVVSELGVEIPQGKDGDLFRSRLHTRLRRACVSGMIKQKQGMHWYWIESDEDLNKVRSLVADFINTDPQAPKCARTLHDVPAGPRSIADSSFGGEGFFKPADEKQQHKQQVHAQLCQTVSHATNLACRPRNSKKCAQVIGQKQLRILKRKWFDAAMTEVREEVRREWEALPQDAVTSQLLIWRYEILGAENVSDKMGCKGRLRTSLDALIMQRQMEKNAQYPATCGKIVISSESLAVDGIPNHSETGSRTRLMHNQLLDQLGILNASIPHPAIIHLEQDAKFAADMKRAYAHHQHHQQLRRTSSGSGLPDTNGGVAGDQDLAQTATMEALKRYICLSSIDRAALWAIVAHRSRRQEQILLQALRPKGINCAVSAVSDAVNGFEVFLEARRSKMRCCPGTEHFDPQVNHVGVAVSTAFDAISELEAETEFTGLSQEEKQWWIKQAEVQHGNLTSSQPENYCNWAPYGE